MKRPLPLLIDCDPGIDDAVALALALASPEVEVLTITTVAGNAPVSRVTRNARRLLHALGRADVPVAAGADRALVRVGHHGLQSPHGEDGLGGVPLADSPAGVAPEHAVDRMAEALRQADPKSVTLVAIGPLTNVALLLALHPDCADLLGRLVVMGGSTGAGNITPLAEFNIWTDPEAAHRVLVESDLDVRLVGLDVTRRATVTVEVLDELRAVSPQGRMLADMVLGYGDRTTEGWPLHDALAVASVVAPHLVVSRETSIEVQLDAGPARGQTVCTFGHASNAPAGTRAQPGTRRCHVAVDLDVDGFRRLLLDRAAHPRP